jgi:2,3-dimethylmalate lyase
VSGRRAVLPALVERRQGLVVPGAYDAVSARLVEQAGFPAVYMTGFGVSASRLGLPDLGFAGLAEMVDQARNLAAAVSIPVIADADTGYGSALQVRRTVQQYEAAGVAALHIEDQVAPKRCGHLAGKQVVPAEEFVGRIRAAVEARTDPDLLVIARTDAIAVTGFDDAVARAEAAARAGADVLFVEAPTSETEIEALPRRLDRPLLFNYAPSGRSPLPPFARLRALGYAVVILPVDLLFVATRAMQRALAELRDRDATPRGSEQLVSFQEFLEVIGLREQLTLGERY